jgi:pimeloyl-ACP methyl ester carboxylesterase
MKPTVLLVHGAWHGAWCWKYQIPELEALGYAVETLDLPCVSGTPGKTQFDDADHVRSHLEALIAAGKQVVVLAHSYGGPIASAAIADMAPSPKDAADRRGFLGLIVLCGFIFPGGMDQGAAIRAAGGLPYVTWDNPSEGLFTLNEPEKLLGVPDDLTDWALAQLRPQSMAANMGIVPPQAWQKDGFQGSLAYIKSTEDAIIPLAHQEAMIEGAGGSSMWIVRTLEGSGHSPQLSRPGEVAAKVEDIVQEFEKNLKKLE